MTASLPSCPVQVDPKSIEDRPLALKVSASAPVLEIILASVGLGLVVKPGRRDPNFKRTWSEDVDHLQSPLTEVDQQLDSHCAGPRWRYFLAGRGVASWCLTGSGTKNEVAGAADTGSECGTPTRGTHGNPFLSSRLTFVFEGKPSRARQVFSVFISGRIASLRVTSATRVQLGSRRPPDSVTWWFGSCQAVRSASASHLTPRREARALIKPSRFPSGWRGLVPLARHRC